MSSRLPDFLLLGAANCGTSALHAALARHPALFLAEPKEPKFFLTDGPPPDSGGGPGDIQTWREHVWRREPYEALFADAASAALCGESTVFYLYDLAAQRRIRALVPQARLIAVLRDPVERAHSNWVHLRDADLEPESDFGAALDREQDRIRDGWAHFWHYVAQGRYGEQLDHLFTLFPPRQVLLLRYRELRDNPVDRSTGCVSSSGCAPGCSPTFLGTTCDRTCAGGRQHPPLPSGPVRWPGSPTTSPGCRAGPAGTWRTGAAEAGAA